MSFKELFKSKNKNEVNEFQVELEEHPLGNQNVYRLCHLYYHNINNGSIEALSEGWFKPFLLPFKMDREDAFKVLSYFTDVIENKYNVSEASYESVATLNGIIDIETYGFRRLNLELSKHDENVIDLFTISGRILRFKKSEYYPKYFNWYTNGVTLSEVKLIYESCGMEFSDIKFVEKQKNTTILIFK